MDQLFSAFLIITFVSMMNWEIWLTASLLILMSIFLVLERIEIEILLLGTLLILMLCGIVPPTEAFSGFANEGVITIAMLFVVVGAISNSGLLSKLESILLGKAPGSIALKTLRMMLPVAFVSAFINNTPVVAMLIPIIRSWTEKYGVPVSKFLIPLSYAAILGGMCTLIGTSTNLVIFGMMKNHGLTNLGLFDISLIGVPLALTGILFIAFIGTHLLPSKSEPLIELGENTREFVIELKVTDEYEHIGKTVEQAGLRHLKGLFLFQIERGDHIIAPATPSEIIQRNDRLFFTGLPTTIIQLQKTPGLVLTKDTHFNLKHYDSSSIRPFECVVSANSPLVGKNIRESNFRKKYGAVILAIHRQGERIRQKIGDIVIAPGDTLLLLAESDFRQRWYHTKDFYLIAGSDGIPSKTLRQAYWILGIFVLVIILTVTNILPLLMSASLGVGALLVTRSIHTDEVRKMIDWRVLTIIALSLGIARSMETSGLAEVLANGIIAITNQLGVAATLAVIYLITSVYTTLISNNAAAALIFPIAYTVSLQMNANPYAFSIAVMIAAAGSFATPISYQTNLMVLGPGRYTYRDFLRIGIPTQILVGVLAILLLNFYYF